MVPRKIAIQTEFKELCTNVIRGFARGSKKQKNGNNNNNMTGGTNFDYDQLHGNPSQLSLNTNANTLYSGNNGSALSLRRTQSPSKQSMKSQRVQSNINRVSNSYGSNSARPLFLCEPFVKTALVKGSFKTIVQLPKYVDYGEWLALNSFETYTHLNQFYGIIVEYSSQEKCPIMNADDSTEYLWIDQTGQPISLSANQYIDYALAWINSKFSDQTVFPTKSNISFPPNFMKDIKNISRQMFRIFAHIYHHHFEIIVHLSLEAHWNSFFAHFISFVREFSLIDSRELEPLQLLIENLEAQGKILVVEKQQTS
ncbi:CBK1 kinase activator protein MOB2 [Komagataella phaffii GS115]|uniref:CBK1 kinase activator protein MOB2 n=1 Tax=Komagataella phaffii (strain GS115 / ATCC 20864) TaxID=644223 RepID=C4QX82_KOMPG|nr:CBK1 kinase activator protein MOB2 [Komagataella phaffii GS115]CAY67855.1 CBK1 kinase activator protein MOB2 [Komagataella phaffii GS115]